MNSGDARKAGEDDAPGTGSPHVTAKLAMAVEVLVDIGKLDLGHRSSHELPVGIATVVR